MKDFYRHTILFALPVVVLLLIIPVSESWKYHSLEKDCFGHASWIYSRINEHDRPVDLAFIGSSRMLNAVNDESLSQHFDEDEVTACNLAYCRLGRNLHLLMAKKLFANHSPQTLVLEIRENEDRYSHPVFPHLANTSDVIFPHLLFNRDYPLDVKNHLLYKLSYYQEYIFNLIEEKESNPELFGTAPSDKIEDPGKLINNNTNQYFNKMDWFYLKFPRAYISKISKLCKKSNSKLVFLYLPKFGSNLANVISVDYYQQYGTVLIPPDSIFNKKMNWQDPTHLNQHGAEDLSSWLISKKDLLLGN